MNYITTISLIALLSISCVQAAWENSELEHNLDTYHDDENPFALEGDAIQDDEFDDDVHLADEETLDKIDSILKEIFDEKDEEAGAMSVEQVTKLIDSGHEMLDKLPKSYEVNDRFNYRNKIIDDLHELSRDLGCSQSDLHYRISIGQLVWDNKLLEPYIKMHHSRQFDQCRERLEHGVLEVAKREKIPSPIEENHLNELRHEIELVSKDSDWIEKPNDKLDDFASKGVANMLKRSTSSDHLSDLQVSKTPEEISKELDVLIRKDCNHVRGRLYDYYDDATFLNEISHEAIEASQWDLLNSEVRNLLESVSACNAIRNIQYGTLIPKE